jgi:hypothetical protein
LRLLRDSEFCTSKHRKLYRERLNKVLGEALTDVRPPRSVADFITAQSPSECLPSPFPNLIPLSWDAVNQPAEWHFPLTINPVTGKLPKRIPFQAADRPAAPRMADQPHMADHLSVADLLGLAHQLGLVHQELEIASIAPSPAPAAPSQLPTGATLPALPGLPGIPHPAMAALSNWTAGHGGEPAIGKLIPASAAPPSFSAAATRLPGFLTLDAASPLAPGPVVDSPALVPFQAANRPAAIRAGDQSIAPPVAPSLQLTASALLSIPGPAMAALSTWSVGLRAEVAMGKLNPAGATATPSFLAAATLLPACLTLDANAPLTLGQVIDTQLLPSHAADRPAAIRVSDRETARETAPPLPASLQLAASALLRIPEPAMAAPATWSVRLQAKAAMGHLIPTGSATPSFLAAAPLLPACLTLDANAPLALGAVIDSPAMLLAFRVADRPAAIRMTDRESAAIPASLQLTASAQLSIPGPAMAAPSTWSDGLQAEPAMGQMLPAGSTAPSFLAAIPRLPACLTLDANAPLALGPVMDSRMKMLHFHAADRPAAIRTGDQEIAPPIPASLQLAASALPGIPDTAMAAQSTWSDGLQAEPAMGQMLPAGSVPWFSAATLRLPECLTLCWDSPLVLGPVIDNRLQLLNFHAADRPAALRAGDEAIAPPISHSLQFTAWALPGIPDPAIGAPSNWSDGPETKPAMGQMLPAGAAPPSFSTAAPRLPAFLTLEPVQAFQSQEPPQEAGFIALEYYCAAAISGPSASMEWKWRAPACDLLPFALELAVEKAAAPPAVKKPVVVPFPVPAAAAVKKPKREGRVIQLAAAAVLLVALTGFGMRFTAGIAMPAIKGDAIAASTPADQSAGPLERVRQAIAGRAKVELDDTFERGMQAWGHAAGWTHNADGYVQTGQLALFQPSMKFKDYRMEFFGQIESKSIGWVVRAHDPQNYYAMKFKIIQSGLRPLIAMVHYPVTGGHAGRPVETPLMDVMMHNNTAYHVAVTVAGNRITTSIEGQEVDRWVDDSIPSGGVGFYSDAGERARLYWMKVSKNEDFLGKVCAYLSGSADASRVFATLVPPGWNYDER